MKFDVKHLGLATLMAASLGLVTGCAKDEAKKADADKPAAADAEKKDGDKDAKHTDGDGDGDKGGEHKEGGGD